MILADPLARPASTLALVVGTALLARLALGATRARRMQGPPWLRGARSAEPVVVVSDEPFAFTTGLLRPRIVVSDALIATVPERHRRVIVAHEEIHRRWRHPLLIFLAESLAGVFPVGPFLRAAQSLRLALEAVADDGAARIAGGRTAVAEAIANVAVVGSGAAVGFEGHAVLRVKRLLARPPRRWAAGHLTGFAVIAIVTFSGAHAVHCGEASARVVDVKQCRTR